MDCILFPHLFWFLNEFAVWKGWEECEGYKNYGGGRGNSFLFLYYYYGKGNNEGYFSSCICGDGWEAKPVSCMTLVRAAGTVGYRDI